MEDISIFEEIFSTPIIKILRQPTPVYRMRYRTDYRKSILYGDISDDSSSISSRTTPPTSTSKKSFSKIQVYRFYSYLIMSQSLN